MHNPNAVNAPVQTNQPPRLGEEILRVDHVCRGFNKTQGELLVLDDANLSLREGEIVGLLGRSGSGKSTLLRIIAGLIEPTGGEVTYLGQPLRGPKASRWCSRPSRCSRGSPCCRTWKPASRRSASARASGASVRWPRST